MIFIKKADRLKQVYEILQKDDLKITKNFSFRPLRPNEDKVFYFNPFNIPNVRSVKSTKERLSKVLAFIDMKKYSRFSDGFTVMNISVLNKRLLSICGSPMNVSRLIEYMIQIGLLAEYDEEYSFNHKVNKCKSYVYCKETEDHIKQYCKDNNIDKFIIKNNIYNTIVNKFVEDVDSFEPSEVRFSSKLHLLKPTNWSTTDFELYLMKCLYENYPQLQHYQDLADTINETYYKDDPDRQVQFKPNFTWSKGNSAVRKIGIRSTNALVSCKKAFEEGDDDNILYRDDVLKRYGLTHEFDVKSSVPRVTFLLNKGDWLDNSIDLYKYMFEDFCPSEEWNSEIRDVFKSFHMRGYFDTYSKVGAHIKLAISKKQKYNKEEWTDLDDLMRSYKNSIERTIGTLKYDSEIFYHESCIYMDVLKELLDSGRNVLQIYDGFYFDKDYDNIEDMIDSKARQYYLNNKRSNNTNNTSKVINTSQCNHYYNTIVNKFVDTKNNRDYIKSLATEALDFDQLE